MTQTIPNTFPPQLFAATATKRLPTAKELPHDDGEPMETSWHYMQFLFLIELIESHWLGRLDFFAGGNMFMYLSEEHVFNKDFRGPDFFVVKGVDHDKDRLSWVSWEEGDRLPDVIVELLSTSTKYIDRTVKKRLYDERFHTAEYFCVDPEDQSIEGWRRNESGYVAIEPDDDGRLWSNELEVSFDWWNGKFSQRAFKKIPWFRMFNAHGEMVRTFAEAAEAHAEAEKAHAEAQSAAAVADAERLRKELDALRQQLNQPKS